MSTTSAPATGTTVKELVDAVAGFRDSELPVAYGPRRAGDPPALVAAADKAKLGTRMDAKAIRHRQDHRDGARLVSQPYVIPTCVSSSVKASRAAATAAIENFSVYPFSAGRAEPCSKGAIVFQSRQGLRNFLRSLLSHHQAARGLSIRPECPANPAHPWQRREGRRPSPPTVRPACLRCGTP